MESSSSIILKPSTNQVIHNGKLTELNNQEIVQIFDDQLIVDEFSTSKSFTNNQKLPQTNEQQPDDLLLMFTVFIGSIIVILVKKLNKF